MANTATKTSAAKKSAAKKATKATKATSKSASRATKAASGTAKRATSSADKVARATKASTRSTGKATKSAAKKVAGSVADGASKAWPAKYTGVGRRPRSGGDDAIAFLKSEHRDVEAMFKKFEGLGDGAHKSREATVAKIIEALSKHAGIEEEILYPEIRAKVESDEKADELVLEALEEHHVAKATLNELEKLPSEHERFKAKVTVLIESVRHHVKEEEEELFPKVRDLFTRSELDDMGARLKAARPSAPSRPHPMAPDEPPANIIANALTAPLDATAKVAGSAAKAVRRAVG